MFVLFVEKSLLHIQVHIASFVVEIVIIKEDLEVYKMRENVSNENTYQVTLFLLRKMLSEGLITQHEYRKTEAMFRQKYAPIFGTLFSDLPLTFLKGRVIYSKQED